MLIEFSVQNFRSIKDRITLSMEATSLKEHPDHVTHTRRQSLLKTSVIYGANASGKSNLFSALSQMRKMMMSSAKDSQADEPMNYDPFLLGAGSQDEPTKMEAIFIIEDAIYRYGFSYTRNKVVSEWLFRKHAKPYAREICLFERKGQDGFQAHRDFKEGDESLQKFLRENTLLISLFAQFNGMISRQIIRYFSTTFIWALHFYMPAETILLIEDGKVPLEWISMFLNAADLQIKEILINDESLHEEESLKPRDEYSIIKTHGSGKSKVTIHVKHEYYDELEKKYKSQWFDLYSQESEGVKKLFCLAGLIYISIQKGYRLFIDEIGANLHPSLSRLIFRLYQDPDINKNGAQLVATTHDITHLNRSLFRRDQIWFTEKTSSQNTDLYSLAEYKLPQGKARNDASYGKDYFRGKYGAVPFVDYDSFTELFKMPIAAPDGDGDE